MSAAIFAVSTSTWLWRTRPFAGDIKQTDMLAPYVIAQKDNGKYESSVGRDLLFIERNLDFLKPGGRMAVVLPQGRFNNSSDQRVRKVHHGTVPHSCGCGAAPEHVQTPTQAPRQACCSSRNGIDDADAGPLCPMEEDYNSFFATQQVESVNNRGEKVYVKNPDGTNKRDDHGHFIVDHDLFNHEGKSQDGVSEAFIEFAKKEGLSFFL